MARTSNTQSDWRGEGGAWCVYCLKQSAVKRSKTRSVLWLFFVRIFACQCFQLKVLFTCRGVLERFTDFGKTVCVEVHKSWLWPTLKESSKCFISLVIFDRCRADESQNTIDKCAVLTEKHCVDGAFVWGPLLAQQYLQMLKIFFSFIAFSRLAFLSDPVDRNMTNHTCSHYPGGVLKYNLGGYVPPGSPK